VTYTLKCKGRVLEPHLEQMQRFSMCILTPNCNSIVEFYCTVSWVILRRKLSDLQKPVNYTLAYYTLLHIFVHIFLCVFGVLHFITP